MTDDRLTQLAADATYTRQRVDELFNAVSDFKQDVEGRVAKLEVKSGLWGALGGLIAVAALKMRGHP